MTEQVAYSVAVAATKSGISRARLYVAIGEGKLLARKFGRSTLIREVDLQAFLAALPPIGSRQAK